MIRERIEPLCHSIGYRYGAPLYLTRIVTTRQIRQPVNGDRKEITAAKPLRVDSFGPIVAGVMALGALRTFREAIPAGGRRSAAEVEGRVQRTTTSTRKFHFLGQASLEGGRQPPSFSIAGWLSALGVRRDKAALSSGCKAHPAIRSRRKQSEQSWR
jgi:hypothetical protein